MKEKIKEEVILLQKLNHPHIMKLEDDSVYITKYQNEVIIVSELAEQNLEEFIRNKDSDILEVEILKIFIQILLGLDYLHYKRVEHKYLKPSNILLFNDSTTAKIVDFGQAGSHYNISLITTDVSPNTGYMAPEVLSDFREPFKSDIYSLGCILLFMMTKQHPKIITNGEVDLSGIDS